MNFYEVLVSSPSYHGKEALTYGATDAYKAGTVVVVPLRQKAALGIIVQKTSRPSFATKNIVRRVTGTPLPGELLKLLEWLYTYYPAPLGFLAQQLLPNSLLQAKKEAPTLTQTETPPLSLPTLTNDQSKVIEHINNDGNNTTFMVHGATGSGKTRVYIELAKTTLTNGRSVLLLTPEIGLTSQLEQTLSTALGASVITIHSNLSPMKRRTLWLQILTSAKPLVVLGPRSALFSPMHNLGLIVVDEAHEQAYKQEQAPHYQALRVSSKLAQLHHAKLIFGTATPSVNEYWMAQAKQIPILSMQKGATHKPAQRTVQVIDLRERSLFSRQPHISTPLLHAIDHALAKSEQSLVFLNRRGTARLILCSDCGWTANCSHCDLPLTYHADSHQTRCHTCGYKGVTPSKCLNCSSIDIIFKNIGTKAIADQLQKEFPKARIQRFDTDNLKHERLEAHYSNILAGHIDILVGTQMLAKGLDLPKLSVVGIVTADTSLYLPDYTAEERTFQLINQVMGRVGRGHIQGKVIVQTYNPQNLALMAALENKWEPFYEAQLKERQKYRFPPFYHILKLTCARASQSEAASTATRLRTALQKMHLPIIVDGPAPSFHEKINNKYRWQLVVKAKQRSQLLKVIAALPSGWSYDIDPNNLL